jgi:mannose-1-phosphate guanylyltransferase
MNSYYAVIMAGGGGTRLWPLSRQDRPKQSLQLLGERTMFQIAVERLAPLFAPGRILVVTGAGYADDLRAQCPALPADNFIIEPEPRGTAPAIGLAALAVKRRDPNGVMACLTADHFIGDEARFRDLLAAAAQTAERGHLVTLGITPTFASTGFGYIQRGALLGSFGGFEVYRAARFKEKPAPAEAEAMLADGLHAWNSGMFVWRVADVMAEFERQLPELHQILRRAEAQPDSLGGQWQAVSGTTIDYGIMERARDVALIPATGLGWSDIGSWAALFEVLPADTDGNLVVGGEHAGLDTVNTLVHASGRHKRLIATIGVENLVIVETDDVLLICPREKSQQVRAMVEQLKKQADKTKYL